MLARGASAAVHRASAKGARDARARRDDSRRARRDDDSIRRRPLRVSARDVRRDGGTRGARERRREGGTARRRRARAAGDVARADEARANSETDEGDAATETRTGRSRTARRANASASATRDSASNDESTTSSFVALTGFVRAREVMAVASDAARRQRALGREMVSAKSTTKMSAVAPLFTLAAVKMVDRKMIPLVTQSVASFIKLYLLLLFVRVLLTWFPNVNWMRQPWTMLRQVTDPYLNLFRNLIPPVMGQIDFTPILGFMVLQFLARVLSADSGMGKF